MNFRYAFRSIRKSPLVTITAILSLALGIGANTAIFSLTDQLLLRMLPVQSPRQLVQLVPGGPEIGAMWGEDRMSYPMYRDIRDKSTVFSGVLAWYSTPASLGFGGRTERILSELVTGNYFDVLGVQPTIGRTFTSDDDDSFGAEPVAVLTYDFWKSRFGADENIVGTTIHLNGHSMTVIGVSAWIPRSRDRRCDTSIRTDDDAAANRAAPERRVCSICARTAAEPLVECLRKIEIRRRN